MQKQTLTNTQCGAFAAQKPHAAQDALRFWWEQNYLPASSKTFSFAKEVDAKLIQQKKIHTKQWLMLQKA